MGSCGSKHQDEAISAGEENDEKTDYIVTKPCHNKKTIELVEEEDGFKKITVLEESAENGLDNDEDSSSSSSSSSVVSESDNELAAEFSGGLEIDELEKDKYILKEWDDRETALRKCSIDPDALKYAPKEIRNDKEIVLAAALAACSQYGYCYALQYASKELRNDKEVVMAACSKDGGALKYASKHLKNDREVVATACIQNERGLYFASKELQNDYGIVLAACSQHGLALQHASQELRDQKQIVLEACSQNGWALQYASKELKNNEEVVLMACSQKGQALNCASDQMKNTKGVVLVACSRDGNMLQHVPVSLRADKEVVMAAVKSRPTALKFALGGLHQDKDCLIRAGLWDKDYVDRETTMGISNTNKNTAKRIVLSTRFSLSAESSPHATNFTLRLKDHPYIKQSHFAPKYIKGGNHFAVYSPNAFNKGTCDPNWTDKTCPCRGTYDTCRKPHHLKIGVPKKDECCWRYSFRYQLEEAHRGGGFMLQVVDLMQNSNNSGGIQHQLGDGQQIETEMAQQVGIKIFRYFQPFMSMTPSSQVDELVSKIHAWYKGGCRDMEICIISDNY